MKQRPELHILAVGGARLAPQFCAAPDRVLDRAAAEPEAAPAHSKRLEDLSALELAQGQPAQPLHNRAGQQHALVAVCGTMLSATVGRKRDSAKASQDQSVCGS